MKRVTGIGGIFFHATDPVALQAWYKQHLGIDVQAWGAKIVIDSAGLYNKVLLPSNYIYFPQNS